MAELPPETKTPPREEMAQQVLRKDDGRYLILYSFKPAGTQTPATDKGDSSQ
jgi:hypothetical protein